MENKGFSGTKSEHDKARKAFIILHHYCINRETDCSDCCFFIPKKYGCKCIAEDFGEDCIVKDEKEVFNNLKDRCKKLNKKMGKVKTHKTVDKAVDTVDK